MLLKIFIFYEPLFEKQLLAAQRSPRLKIQFCRVKEMRVEDVYPLFSQCRRGTSLLPTSSLIHKPKSSCPSVTAAVLGLIAVF